MKNVLVLISDPARPAVTAAVLEAATEALRTAGARVGTADWLAPGIACDLPFDGPAGPVTLAGVDAVALPAADRRKRLLVADMESTMIHNEMLDELADFLGLRDKIAGITARAMNGEIDFAGALNERVDLLKGLSVAKLDEAATRIRYMPGGATLVATMRKHGAYCALVSGGFTYFTAMVPDSAALPTYVARVVPFPTSATPGQRARVELLNGTTKDDAALLAAPKVVAAGGEISLLGNASSFDVATTTVQYMAPEAKDAADAIAKTLGVSATAATSQSGGIDVRVTIGRDRTA